MEPAAGMKMDEAAVDKRIDEIKSLLERIDRKGAATWRHRAERGASGESVGLAPHADLLTAEYRDYLAGKRTSGPGPWVFLLAMAMNTVVVVVVAAIVLGTMGHEVRLADLARLSGITSGAPAHRQSMAAVEPVELASIGTADAPLRLTAGQREQLPLGITRGISGIGDGFFVFSELPPSATLIGAARIGTDRWLLPVKARDALEIVVADKTDGAQFEVQLRFASGVVAARTNGWLQVSAPEAETTRPGNAGAGAAEITDLIRRGEQLLAAGDIVRARSLYERAAQAGSADAALVLGASYDPNRLWFLGAIGMTGNSERATNWYRRADELGHPHAKRRLDALAK